MLKVYCDASFHPETGRAGIAVVVYRDEIPVYLMTDEIEAHNPSDAECIALRRGTEEIRAYYPDEPYVLYTDCKTVADKIREETALKIEWIPRDKNMVADALADCAHHFSVTCGQNVLNKLCKGEER